MKREKKNLLLISLVVLIPIIIIATITFFILNSNNHARIRIINLEEYVSGKTRNKKEEEKVEQILYDTSKLNKPETGNNETAKIREGTFSQTAEGEINYVEFTVDIERLQETFQIRYTWNNNPEVDVDEWGTSVLCPNSELMIYADFNCTDFWKETYGTNDEIVFKLPYHKIEEYFINYDKDSGKIIIEIYGCRTETIEPRVKSANEWLKTNIKNLENYEIEYEYCK